MIITVVYGGKLAKHDGLELSKQLIDCERIYYLEDPKQWGFMAYGKNDVLITEHKFDLTDTTKAYISVDGRTIDVLPRK